MTIKMGEVYECQNCKSVFSVVYDPTDNKSDVFESLDTRHKEIKPECVSTTGFKLLNQFVKKNG